jgi:hypothetical protein
MIAALLLAAAAAHSAETASAVVRSKEWVVRRGASREEEFIGDVRYESAGARLTSDWALYKHVEKRWQAKGRVRLRKELDGGDVLEASGERARYDEAGRDGTLEPGPGGRVAFKRVPPAGDADFGEAERLSWNDDRSATLSGGARGWGPRGEFWADEARYTGEDRRLRLNGGRPVLHKIEGEWTTALKADTVAASDAPRRIEASGGVHGWLLFKDQAKLKELGR